MAAKQRDMSDSMHYESRQIREALAASNARLKSARSGRVPADLQPQLGSMMLQEWEGLSGTGHLDQDNTLASSNPLYQQMRAALLAFESEVGYAAPARERAFFSALRTQLMEAGALRDAEQRDMQLTAAFKWFSRHKPQGPEADPITAAVLASSLSVEANAAPAQPEMRTSSPGTPLHAATQQQQQQQQQQRLPSPPSPSAAGTGNGGGSSAAMPGSYTKHYFFDVYSRAPVVGGGGTSGGGGTPALPSSSGAGPGLRPTSARGPSPGGRSAGRVEEAPSLSINHPLAMYPSVSAAAAPLGGAAAATSTADKASAAGPASGGSGGNAQPRARFASTEMYAPAKLVRPQEFDELDHRAAQVAAAAAAAGVSGAAAAADHGGASGSGAARSAAPVHSKPWVSGPHKSTLGGLTAVLGGGGSSGGGGGAGRGGGGATAVRHTSKPGHEEEEEVQLLRSKWSEMETKTSKSVADVQAKVAEWTLQRARLEEEIVRRQEAGRIAPLNGSLGQGGNAPPWQVNGFRRSEYEEGPLGQGSLSPYANANADLAAATAAAAAGPGAMNGIMGPTGGLHGAAAAALGASMRQRHADVSTYDRNRPELLRRLNSLGVPVSRDTLDRALRPLEDRPFLDCIARLPKPGDHLVSRPGSVRLPAAKKKKRSKSAGKKRPTSGTR